MERSRAYGRLDTRFDEVRTLLKLCSSPESSQQTRRVAADGALLRGALVLLCSHLEGFFEELIEDTLRSFNFLAPTIAQIPLAIRKRQVTHRLRLDLPPDLEQDWLGLRECVEHPLLHDDHSCLPGSRRIDSDLHIKSFTNPGSKEIERLMTSIGISRCWTIIEKQLGRHGRDTVDAVVNRRNQIAHGNLESSVSRPDVEDYISVLERVCVEFDAGIGQHITTCTGNANPWSAIE